MNINPTIIDFIVSELCTGDTVIGEADQLIEQGIIDSVGIMSLIGFLEERFAINISGDELVPENFNTVSSISSLVNKKMAMPLEA